MYLAAGLLILSAAMPCLWRARRNSANADGWGRGQLKVSEAAYYVARIGRIVQQWREMAARAEQDADGRLKQPYPVYLVIDTTAQAVWIEASGTMLPEFRCELRRGLTWRVHHCEPKGTKELPGPVRLQFRGLQATRQWPESLYLVGQSGSREHLSFLIGCRVGLNGDHGKGRFVPTGTQHILQDGVDYYESILVGDAEYKKQRPSLSAAEGNNHGVSGLVAWSKVEKRLYQTIESQIGETGFRLYDLKVEPGPAWSAAHAHVSARRGTRWQHLFGGVQQATGYMKIDHLGEGLWYASTAPQALPGGATVLELEFVVSESGSPPPEERSHRVVEGRERQHPTTPPASPWQVALPNGATVAILGISQVTDGERPWWGPDGSTVPSIPEFYCESRPPQDKQLARRYEMVWIVDWPSPLFGSTHFCWASKSRSDPPLLPCIACDRYGERYRHSSDMDIVETLGSPVGGAMRCLHAGGILCGPSDTQATFSLGLRFDNGNVEWVTFRSISLRPGEDPGFEIVQGLAGE